MANALLLEFIIFRIVAILLILTGFALNLRCDPLHEWMPTDDAHAEHGQDDSSPDSAKDPVACRSHCQFMHTMAWIHADADEEPPQGGRRMVSEFFYEDLQASPYPLQLLRPPTTLALS